jgi:small subunit ribosomal protein S19e
MVSLFDVNARKLIEKAAKKLQEGKIIEMPEWANFVKTGRHKERPPMRKDWWYVRAAAVLRSVYKLGPIGTEKLRTKYGGRQERGYQPARFTKGSGSVIRKILQQLEKIDFIKKVEKGVHKGRVIAPKGKSFLDKTAVEILKENGKKQTKSQEVKASQESKPN